MQIKRDFIGYANNIKKFHWPKKYQMAINFIVNYEEGAEQNILDGDQYSENYLVDIPQIQALKSQRHLSSESMFEYGSRVGIWRLANLFDEYKIPLTYFCCGLALERNTVLAHYLKESSHEVAGHGYRWINYRNIDYKVEREHFEKTINIIKDLTHKKTYGWYTGRSSENTQKLIFTNNLLYSSDNYADDLPYWQQYEEKAQLIIPYNLENNDMHYVTSPGFATPNDFLQQLIFNFDCLYRESKNNPTLMTIGLHPRLSGKPARTEVIRKFLDYILPYENIWFCRRFDIAEYWIKNYLYTSHE